MFYYQNNGLQKNYLLQKNLSNMIDTVYVIYCIS